MLRLYGDRSKLFAKLSIATGLVAGAGWLWAVEVTAAGRVNLGPYVYVSWLAWQTIDDPVELTIDGEKYRARPSEFVAELRETDYQGRTMWDLVRRSLWAGGAGAVVAFGLLTYLAGRARPVDADEDVIKGKGMRAQRAFQTVVADGSKKKPPRSSGRRALFSDRKRVASAAVDRDYPPQLDPRTIATHLDLGGLRLPAAEEQQHMLILGDSGAGKSSLLRWYLLQIRLRGEPAIVVDLEREFLQTFYEPAKGDVILNATDARMPAWAPGFEVETVGEAESLAESFIPGEPNGMNSFFTSSARAAFVDLLATLDADDPGAIARACAMPLEDLHPMVQGRPSASALSPVAPQTAENVRATLQAATRGLGLLPKVDTRRTPWTIKEWTRSPRGWIFLTSLETEWVATKPLVTAWLDMLIRNLMIRPQGAKPVVHVVVDEMAALGRSRQVVDVATRGRKRGIAAKLAAQAVSQIEKNYGQDAPSLLSQPKVKVIYRCSEPKLAEWGSKLIGSVERRVERVNLRADINSTGRDSVSLSDDTRIQPIVLPIELAQLPDFQAYLVWAGQTTWLTPPYTRMLTNAPDYIPRPGEERLLRSRRRPATPPKAPVGKSRPETGGRTHRIGMGLGADSGSDKSDL